MAEISVLVADAQELLSDALAGLLGQEPGLTVLEERPSSGLRAIEVAAAEKPDVVLMDYWMDPRAPAAVRLILEAHPGCKVLVLSWLNFPDQIQEVLDCGAVGFLPKSVAVADVAEAIRRAQRGQRPPYPENIENLVRTLKHRDEEAEEAWRTLKSLTPAEVRVMRLLGAGMRAEEVAASLSMSLAAVRAHIRQILDKTDAPSQVEALAVARRFGVIVG